MMKKRNIGAKKEKPCFNQWVGGWGLVSKQWKGASKVQRGNEFELMIDSITSPTCQLSVKAK